MSLKSLVLGVTLSAFAMGCGEQKPTSTDGPKDPSVASSILINPPSTTIEIGDHADLFATVFDQYAQPMGVGVVWSFTNGTGAVTIIPVGNDCEVTGATLGSATVRATCNGVIRDCAITVSPLPPPPVAIATPAAGPLSDATEGYSYSPIQWTTTGGSGAKTWSILSGSIPTGMTFDSNGYLSGTPDYGQGGLSFTFTVQVSDVTGTSTRDHSLYVEYGYYYDDADSATASFASAD